jgi:hypothetical protein
MERRGWPRSSSMWPNIGEVPANAGELTADGRFPAQLDREYEERLLDLCASGDLEPTRWRRSGPAFFMAGLAVMLDVAGRIEDTEGRR